MPKRKKYPNLPNGFGTIRYLGKGRKNCFAVHPPATEQAENGHYITPKAICYTDDWYVGFAVLNAYRAGTYKPGDELKFKQYKNSSDIDIDSFCKRLLTDYAQHTHAEVERAKVELTFAEVYKQYFEWKYGENSSKKLSPASQTSTNAAFQNAAKLHNRIFQDITVDELQDVLDSCTLKVSSVNNIKILFNQMYKYAVPRKIVDMNYASGVVMPSVEENEPGVPFSDGELERLWLHKDDPTIEFILIMCYSGYRIAAYLTLEVNLEEKYFCGGNKTKAGRGNYVPIHSAILPLVESRIKRDGALFKINPNVYRRQMYRALDGIYLKKHTPHDCRHTFSRLLEKYKADENDRKRLLGHSFGNDITNKIYGHRTVEELRVEIEKIKVPNL